jgi:hypothetical protein
MFNIILLLGVGNVTGNSLLGENSTGSPDRIRFSPLYDVIQHLHTPFKKKAHISSQCNSTKEVLNCGPNEFYHVHDGLRFNVLGEFFWFILEE